MGNNTEVFQVLNELDRVSFLRILSIILIAWAAVKLIELTLPQVANKLPGKMRFYVLPSVPVIRLLIIILSIILIFPIVIKPTFESLVAVLGAAVITLGFAFRDYVSSLIAGLVAIYEHPYRAGDWIKVDDAYGEVKSLDLRAVTILTPDDTTVTIPHTKLWNTNVFNANDGRRELMCVANFYVNPRHKAEKVRRKLKDVILTSPYLKLDNPVGVIVCEKPWGTHYQLKAYPVDGRDQFRFISDLTIRGREVLEDMNVEPVLTRASLNFEQ